MFSFEGKFRTTPTVSLGGRSKRGKLDKGELLEKAQRERQKREDIRRRLQSALVIQSCVRSYFVRQKLKKFFREQFDQERHRVEKEGENIDALTRASIWLRYFYKPATDDDRLNWFGQQLLRNKTEWISKDDVNLFKTSGILKLCCRCLRNIDRSSQIAIPLRLFETFTSAELIINSRNTSLEESRLSLLKLWDFLSQNGYFSVLLHLFSTRVPSDLSPPSAHDDDIVNIPAPTPIAETLLSLVVRPLIVAGQSSESANRPQSSDSMDFTESSTVLSQNSILRTFILQMLHQHPTTQLYYYVYPALGRVPELPVLLIFETLRTLVDESNKKISFMLLPALIRLANPSLGTMSGSTFALYLYCLKCLILQIPRSELRDGDETSSDEDYDDDSAFDSTMTHQNQIDKIPVSELVADIHGALSSRHFIDACLSRKIHEDSDSDSLDSICAICYYLLALPKAQIKKNRLLHTLAFSTSFLRKVWLSMAAMSKSSGLSGKSIPVLQLLFEKNLLTESESSSIRSKLVVFCSLFTHNLLSIHDADIYNASQGLSRHMAFMTNELVTIALTIRDVTVALIKRAFPETRCRFGSFNAKSVLHALSFGNSMKLQNVSGRKFDEAEMNDINETLFLFKVCKRLVRHLHTRDTRKSFVPKRSWLSNSIFVKSEQSHDFAHRWHQRSEKPSVADHLANTSDEDVIVSVTEARQLAVLMNIPFVIPFETRVSIFMTMLTKNRTMREDHREMVMEAAGYGMSTMTNEVSVRRDYVYEDAFSDLSNENAPDLRRRLRVTFRNAAGAEEAGYGAGVTREFLQQVIKAGFNPTRGFFKTTAQGRLYPNPQAKSIFPNANDHFYFLGRMLGKVLYEGMQVELPFASFFLCKILQKKNADVDINHLQSLDPDFYKNLMSLRDYDGDIADLELNFTVVNESLGVTREHELIKDGRNIMVTNSNKILYMHLMADYKLNVEMREPCRHFHQGLESVITVDWLQMFDHEEFQTLVSGAEVPIDIEDMKRNAAYSGGYTDEHPTIKSFWKVISDFTNKQLSLLLLFVTSCSRPPLLGFKELQPPFCIQKGGSEDRLPTASTCLNLLKLPEYPDEDSLRTKLLYCLQSGTGFELS